MHKEFEDKATNKELTMLGLRAPTQLIKDPKSCMIYPDTKFKSLFWDTMISMVLLITCFVTPFHLAFADDLDQIQWLAIVNYTIDALFLVDIFINFNTAYKDEINNIVDDRKTVAKTYLTGWFIIDFLSIFPLDLIIVASNGAGVAKAKMNAAKNVEEN